ncbi:MAG: DNA-binding transcriptional ArsR family regulator [Sulfitobacter sp.]
MPALLTTALEDRADLVAQQLALLANPRRLMILCKLAEGECSVGDLLAAVDLGQSALSQHLAKLRSGNIVSTRRQGQTIFYRISDPKMQILMATLYEVYCQDRLT